MNTLLSTFELDPDHTLGLARELEAAAQPERISVPALPGGAVADFCAALASAHENLLARHAVLRADLAQLADAAVATTHATLAVDGTGAAAFGALTPGGA